jgi:hypothetical protein
MSGLDAIVGRRTIRQWTPLDLGECRRRLVEVPDLPFTTSYVASGKLSVQKVIPPAWRHLRRQSPPVVYAELNPAERGTWILVEGRMSYGQLASVAFLTLFFCVALGRLFVVPAVENGQSLNDVAPFFIFVVGFSALSYLSSLLGAMKGTRELAARIATVLEAGPEAE